VDTILYARRPAKRQVHRLQTIYKKGRTSLYVCREVMGKGQPVGTFAIRGSSPTLYFGFCRLNSKDLLQVRDETVSVWTDKNKTIKKGVTRKVYTPFSKAAGTKEAYQRAALALRRSTGAVRHINLSEGWGWLPKDQDPIHQSSPFGIGAIKKMVRALEKGNAQFVETVKDLFGPEFIEGELKISNGEHHGQ